MGRFKEFWNALLNELQNGLFYFTSPWEVFAALLDIAVTTFLIYYVLKLLSESQAWQLLKGIVAVFIVMVIGGLLGLNTLNYILVNFASVFAIGLIIIFQPELRRALETVGRKSSNLFVADSHVDKNEVRQMVESIVIACEQMAAEGTGALIIIERETKLSDLVESESGSVVIDAELTSTMLRQIFYINSPMHDGAVIIRDGRIYATRVHVPLGESYSLKREYGTRHRAAIGASEIGDAISIVVSEEHNTISIAVHGRLYTLDDADSLRTVLNRLLNPGDADTTSLPRKIRKILRIDKSEKAVQEQKESEKTKATLEQISQLEDAVIDKKEKQLYDTEVTASPKRNTAGIFVLSLLIALALWVYVRITLNPVVQRTYTVPLQTVGVENLYDKRLDYYMGETEIRVTIKGREQMFKDLDASDIKATVDFSNLQDVGTYNLPTNISLNGINDRAYTAVREPSHVSVIITQDTTVKDPENAKINADSGASDSTSTAAGNTGETAANAAETGLKETEKQESESQESRESLAAVGSSKN